MARPKSSLGINRVPFFWLKGLIREPKPNKGKQKGLLQVLDRVQGPGIRSLVGRLGLIFAGDMWRLSGS